MDISNTIELWLAHYGSVALFFMLALGIVGLPIPDETILIFCGYMISKNQMPLIPIIIASISGSMTGITMSYLLGTTTGNFLLQRFGKYIGMHPKRIQRVHDWFDRIGKWTLTVGYFIPGVRHFTGYVAGSVKMPYREFALFAYSGAVIWSQLFLAIGYFVHGTTGWFKYF